jgi:hypothetical protein
MCVEGHVIAFAIFGGIVIGVILGVLTTIFVMARNPEGEGEE